MPKTQMTKPYRIIYADGVIGWEMCPAPAATVTETALPCAEFDTEEEMNTFITEHGLTKQEDNNG